MQVDLQYRTGDSNGVGALNTTSAPRLSLSTQQNNGVGVLGKANGLQATTMTDVAAYVQLGGLTAGRLQSQFTFAGPSGGQAIGYAGVIGGDSPYMQNQAGYTISAGNGFTATVSVEDPTERRMGIASVNTAGTTTRTTAAPAVGALAAADKTTAGGQYLAGVGYGANIVPDFVGNVTLNQSWGQIKASGAYHQVVDAAGDIGSKTGYAGQLGAKINLPMIAAGDAFYIQGGYAQGANSYLWNGLTNDQPGVTSSASNITGINFTGNNGLGYGNVAATLADGVVDQNRKLTLAKSMGLAAALDHYWVPTVHSWVAASYTAIDWSSSVRNTAFISGGAMSSVANVDPAKHYMVSVGTEWNPVKGLAIGTEVSWAQVSLKDAAPGVGNGGVANSSNPEAGDKKSQDVWGVRFRVKRDF
jgi:Porin subfamily